MDLATLQAFFMWCTIIDLGVILLWALFFIAAPDLIYRIQNSLFPLPRETYNVVIYSFLAMFKIMAIVFHVVPWLALSILG